MNKANSPKLFQKEPKLLHIHKPPELKMEKINKIIKNDDIFEIPTISAKENLRIPLSGIKIIDKSPALLDNKVISRIKTDNSPSSKRRRKSSLNVDKIEGISNSVNLMGVLKLIKKFYYNLKYSIFYKQYVNLSNKHYAIINDNANIYKNHGNAIIFKDLTLNPKPQNEIIKFFTESILKIFLFFSLRVKFILSKIYKCYNHYFSVINPDNRLIFYWNLTNIMCIMTFFIFIPLETSFLSIMPDNIIEVINIMKKSAFIIFLIDMILKLHVGYYNEVGEKVMIRKNIWLKYLKYSFVYDIIFSLAYLIDLNNTSPIRYLGYLTFFKYFHLRQIILSTEEKFSFSDFSEGIFLLIKLILKILFIAHIIACFFHIIGTISLENNNKSWFLFLDPLKIDEWKYRYIYSIYWSVTTVITVGYGDITPQNQYEVIFSIFIILIGCGTFAYSINKIGTIFSAMASKEENFNKELRILNRFMNKNNLNNDLQCRVRKYFKFVKQEGDEEEIFKESSIISKLSSNLQNEIILNTNGYILKKMKFFYINFSEEFLQKLVNKIKKKQFLPEEHIFQENDPEMENCYYYIKKGQVELYLNCMKNGKYTKLCSLESGETFNEIPFALDSISQYSAKSINYTTIFYINRNEFISLLKESKNDYEKFCMIKDKLIFNDDLEDMKINCKLCNKNNHFIKDCPSINVEKNIYKILKTYQKSFNFIKIKRSRFVRKIKKLSNKSNSLIIKKNIEDKANLYNSKNVAPNYINSTHHNNIKISFKPEKLSYENLNNTDEKSAGINIPNKSDEKSPGLKNQINCDSNSDDESKKKNNNLFWFLFDRLNLFEYYFPRNNYIKVIGKILKKNIVNKKKINKTITFCSPGGPMKYETRIHPKKKTFFKKEDPLKYNYSLNTLPSSKK